MIDVLTEASLKEGHVGFVDQEVKTERRAFAIGLELREKGKDTGVLAN